MNKNYNFILRRGEFFTYLEGILTLELAKRMSKTQLVQHIYRVHFFLSIAQRHSYCYFGFRKLCLLGVFVKQKRPTQKSQACLQGNVKQVYKKQVWTQYFA
jgi:hypothetical protein